MPWYKLEAWVFSERDPDDENWQVVDESIRTAILSGTPFFMIDKVTLFPESEERQHG